MATEYEHAQYGWGNDLILENGYCPCDSVNYVTGDCPIHDTKKEPNAPIPTPGEGSTAAQ